MRTGRHKAQGSGMRQAGQESAKCTKLISFQQACTSEFWQKGISVK